MKHNVLYIVLLALLTIMGCQEQLLPEDMSLVDNSESIYAEIEQGDSLETKTYIDEFNNVRFQKGDQIALFKNNTVAEKYQVSEEAVSETSGDFYKIKNTDGTIGAGSEVNAMVAYYPYSSVKLERASFQNDEYVLTGVRLPSTQKYDSKTIVSQNMLPMVSAKTGNDETLTFRNLCGVLKLNIKGFINIRQISFKGNNRESISGDATVSVKLNGMPEIMMTNHALDEVILDCGEAGITLDPHTAKEFMIVLPPIVFEKGFEITVTDTEGKTIVKRTDRRQEIKRSRILTMGEWKIVEKSSIVEFIKKADSSVIYELTGKLENLVKGDRFWGFDINDGTGVVKAPFPVNWDDWKDKLSNGGTVTVQGTYDYYSKKDSHQVKNCKIIAFDEGDTPHQDRIVREFLSKDVELSYDDLTPSVSSSFEWTEINQVLAMLGLDIHSFKSNYDYLNVVDSIFVDGEYMSALKGVSANFDIEGFHDPSYVGPMAEVAVSNLVAENISFRVEFTIKAKTNCISSPDVKIVFNVIVFKDSSEFWVFNPDFVFVENGTKMIVSRGRRDAEGWVMRSIISEHFKNGLPEIKAPVVCRTYGLFFKTGGENIYSVPETEAKIVAVDSDLDVQLVAPMDEPTKDYFIHAVAKLANGNQSIVDYKIRFKSPFDLVVPSEAPIRTSHLMTYIDLKKDIELLSDGKNLLTYKNSSSPDSAGVLEFNDAAKDYGLTGSPKLSFSIQSSDVPIGFNLESSTGLVSWNNGGAELIEDIKIKYSVELSFGPNAGFKLKQDADIIIKTSH